MVPMGTTFFHVHLHRDVFRDSSKYIVLIVETEKKNDFIQFQGFPDLKGF